MSDFAVRTDACDLDFLALGAVVHRLDPGVIPFRKARSFDIHVSGGEYNVAANLSDCFGLRTGVATAMIDSPLGELLQDRIRETGVRPFYKRFRHDGVRGPNIASIYSDRGFGVRPPIVFYNRANEAGGLLKPGDFDWSTIFSGGLRWFHTGGIFAALSPTTAELILEGMAAAKSAGAICSFDLNYRAKLWAPTGGAEKARQVLRRIAGQVDVLFGNEEDMQTGLGIPGPDVATKSDLDAETFFRMIDRTVQELPNIRLVATTLREVHSANRHDWAAVMWLEGKRYVSPTRTLDILDRIGGGDGFAAGVMYGLIMGRPAEEALRLGWASGALVTTYPGDVSMATVAEVEALANGGSSRVQR
ncbi:MAG TPA: sugar kinase [Gemmataceae bacterium]|jgi:2-dehydro-3-deoxygluconokinase|nr:sugar kinase [Gemmataceae bacterium]